ncbi:hypothetical protein MTR_7g118390 [Medicago truncatula]|uniref:Uncharacterized protein n=1 Tax=Medicago truncatula TaxID=3880 RepID=G7L563_MEDTR|nr:hypothetical protein MTR_7g118390 [Medicago truncatula]
MHVNIHSKTMHMNHFLYPRELSSVDRDNNCDYGFVHRPIELIFGKRVPNMRFFNFNGPIVKLSPGVRENVSSP